MVTHAIPIGEGMSLPISGGVMNESIDGDEDENHDGEFDPSETDPNDPTKVKVMQIIKGAQSFESFTREIEALLNPADDAVAKANP